MSTEATKLYKRPARWAGLFMGAAAWGLHQQLSSMLAYTHCGKAPTAAIGAGVLCALTALFGAWLSWREAKASPPLEPAMEGGSHHFIAYLSVLAAAIFTLVIVASVLAAVILGCE